MELPHGGLHFRSPEKKFEPVIVFVHHFGGNRSSTRRHVELVNKLGFDAVTFNLSFNSAPKWKGPLHDFVRLGRLALKTDFPVKWAKEIEDVLNSLTGEKIIYSFSSISAAVIKVISERPSKDIKAWICDGGPFLFIYPAFIRYQKYIAGAPLWAQPIGAAFAYALFGGFSYNRRLKKWLGRFPLGFPILSIRAGADVLVPPEAIEAVFDLNRQLNLKVLSLPGVAHLEGLKTAPLEYQGSLQEFLISLI